MIRRMLINGLAVVVIVAGTALGGMAHARAERPGVTPSAIDVCRSLGEATCCDGTCDEGSNNCALHGGICGY